MALGKFTDIIMLLDKSPSMAPIQEATREAVNGFITSQKEVEGEARFTLVQFSGYNYYNRSDYTKDLLYSYTKLDEPMASVKLLEPHEYVANGNGTALRDAVGRLIEERGKFYASIPEGSRPEKIVFVIQTDGEENQSISRFRDPAVLRALIQQQESVYKWEFVYLGANQDAVLVAAQEFGLAAAKAIQYNHGVRGMNSVMASTSESIGTYRKGLSRSVSYTVDMKEQAMARDEDLPKVNVVTDLSGTTPAAGGE